MSHTVVKRYCGHNIKVVFVPRQVLAPFFGLAIGGVGKEKCVALVRDDLWRPVKRFVEAHECYHLTDKHTWLGVFGRELRANFVPGIRHPFGLLACMAATLLSRERIGLYLDRIRKNY